MGLRTRVPNRSMELQNGRLAVEDGRRSSRTLRVGPRASPLAFSQAGGGGRWEGLPMWS